MPLEITNFNPRTRSSNNIIYKYQLTEDITDTKRSISNSFFVRTMAQWNRLPDEIRVIINFTSFESAVDRYLWNEFIILNSLTDSDREPD